MTNISEKLYLKIKSIMDTWREGGIYAISFFVYSNLSYEYKGFNNVAYFAVSYNTEKDCEGAGPYDEERWNYAFWRQNEAPVIDPYEPNEMNELLFDWYEENGISNIGEYKECYDKDGRCIGMVPVGHCELVTLASEVARRLQQEGFVENQFGKKLPIIIHGFEYAWFDVEATQKANLNGEADTFLEAIKQWGVC